MRRVEVPLPVQRQINLLRRRLTRKGHKTGRSLVLSCASAFEYPSRGSFTVVVEVRCSRCGQLYRVDDANLWQCPAVPR